MLIWLVLDPKAIVSLLSEAAKVSYTIRYLNSVNIEKSIKVSNISMNMTTKA